MIRRGIVWFRQDLRLHDNEALYNAIDKCDEVYPIFVFDDRIFKNKTLRYAFPKTGKYRCQFILESIADLRASFKRLGCDLIIRIGKTEDVILELCNELDSSWVYANKERTEEEVKIQDNLETSLWKKGKEIHFSRGKMLYHTQDLPFPVKQTPDTFTNYKKEIEYIKVRLPIDEPTQLKKWSKLIDVGNTPDLIEFGHNNIEPDKRNAYPMKGGETEALKRLQYYLWESNLVENYFNTRNELLGKDYSSKLSAYLSQGCISPKRVYFEIKKYEDTVLKNKSTYWLYFELLWRDYFRLIGKKNGNNIFKRAGLKEDKVEDSKHQDSLLTVWKEGRTGIPFIDANMRELNATGFMSNRGRQNVASFLIKDLHLDWLAGAEYFESLLIDYDPMSNYCNWLYIAGLGNDPRENRYFNIVTQMQKYDPEANYVKTWLPVLKKLNAKEISQLDTISTDRLSELDVNLGIDYPKSMINTQKWIS